MVLAPLGGEKRALASLKGKVVVLDFWATWCPPCRESLPRLQALATDPKKSKQGLVVFAVNEREDAADIRGFLDRNHYSFTVAQDADGSLARAFDVTGLPTTVVIGRDGTIQAAATGFGPATASQIDEAVGKALR